MIMKYLGFPILSQFPTSVQYKINFQSHPVYLNGEEPIRAHSTMELFTRLCTTHMNKTISITLSKRNPNTTKESYA